MDFLHLSRRREKSLGRIFSLTDILQAGAVWHLRCPRFQAEGTDVVEHGRMVYWHRHLPPFDAEALGEHTLEATSGRVPDTIAHREELWSRCKDDLMVHANDRLIDEISRLGGRYAHVLDESIETKHDAMAGEAWLHGRFTYVLYK